MYITMLGTSSGSPTKTRNNSGIVIQKKGSKKWSLIDCGDGIQRQIGIAELNLYQLDTICITHLHGDHFYGLIGLLKAIGFTNRINGLTIIAPKQIKEFMKGLLNSINYRLDYTINFHYIEDGISYNNKDFNITTLKMSHRMSSWGFIFEERIFTNKLNIKKLEEDDIPKGKIWGQIQNGLNKELSFDMNDYIIPSSIKKVGISGDNDRPELWKEIKNLNLLVHESTYTQEDLDIVGPEPQHTSAKLVSLMATDLGLKQLVLTHFSPRYRDNITDIKNIYEIEIEAKEYYKGELYIAKDFDIIEVK